MDPCHCNPQNHIYLVVVLRRDCHGTFLSISFHPTTLPKSDALSLQTDTKADATVSAFAILAIFITLKSQILKNQEKKSIYLSIHLSRQVRAKEKRVVPTPVSDTFKYSFRCNAGGNMSSSLLLNQFTQAHNAPSYSQSHGKVEKATQLFH